MPLARWRSGLCPDPGRCVAGTVSKTAQRAASYFTANDHEPLIQRPKPAHDDALPSGNGIAAQVLLKLGHLTGRMAYLDAAERTLRWAWPTLQQIPNACHALLTALEETLEPGANDRAAG
jgi:uncharacterized protein YyaL (SSP411 family)